MKTQRIGYDIIDKKGTFTLHIEEQNDAINPNWFYVGDTYDAVDCHLIESIVARNNYKFLLEAIAEDTKDVTAKLLKRAK
jgi:hypothetical protein